MRTVPAHQILAGLSSTFTVLSFFLDFSEMPAGLQWAAFHSSPLQGSHTKTNQHVGGNIQIPRFIKFLCIRVIEKTAKKYKSNTIPVRYSF